MLWLWLRHELRSLSILLLLAQRLREQRALRLSHLGLLQRVRLREMRVPGLPELALAVRVWRLLCDVRGSIHLLRLLLSLWDGVAMLLTWLALVLRRHGTGGIE